MQENYKVGIGFLTIFGIAVLAGALGWFSLRAIAASKTPTPVCQKAFDAVSKQIRIDIKQQEEQNVQVVVQEISLKECWDKQVPVLNIKVQLRRKFDEGNQNYGKSACIDVDSEVAVVLSDKLEIITTRPLRNDATEPYICK